MEAESAWPEYSDCDGKAERLLSAWLCGKAFQGRRQRTVCCRLTMPLQAEHSTSWRRRSLDFYYTKRAALNWIACLTHGTCSFRRTRWLKPPERWARAW